MVAYVKGTSRVGIVLSFKQFFRQVVHCQLVAVWREGEKEVREGSNRIKDRREEDEESGEEEEKGKKRKWEVRNKRGGREEK